MLYKKYHRNFVKQFKVGTKIKRKADFRNTTIIKEPHKHEDNNKGNITISIVSQDILLYHYYYVVVFLSTGKINKNLYVV